MAATKTSKKPTPKPKTKKSSKKASPKKPTTKNKTPDKRGAKPGERRGGRSKGTPNLKTTQLQELISEKYPKYHPVLAMIEMSQGKGIDPELKFKCHKEVAGYLYAKRRSVVVENLDELPAPQEVKLTDSQLKTVLSKFNERY